MALLMSEEMDAGPYTVTEIPHSTVTLSDGIRLAIKIWLPCSKDNIEQLFPYFSTEKQLKWSQELHSGSKSASVDEVFPTILECLPYAKDSHMTLERDHSRHTWFSSYGFVDIRLDIRGTGASEGLQFDEYEEQELSDCLEIIEWISSQSWSNKKVGMYGKSWGGFNGLQVAYKQPTALKAVISLYSTDNRYNDDMHYEGNAIIGNGLLSWAGTMMVLNARPPHPRYFDSIDVWKKFWLERLRNAGQSFLCTWLHHQHPCDPYWQHGSICQNTTKTKCPVLIIGGHTDAYTNAAFRMAGTLNQHSRAIIGPWSHQWPDVSIPGPNIDYLHTCLKWWTAYLKDDDNLKKEVFEWARLNLFIRDVIKPQEISNPSPGKWVNIPSWDARLHTYLNFPKTPSEDTGRLLKHVFLAADMKLLFERSANDAEPVELKPNPKQGNASGSWLSIDNEFPSDQCIANESSHCWISDILEEDITFAGLAKMFISVQSKTSGQYCVHVRICDEFPSGESFLVTRGFRNLSEFDDGWVSYFPGNVKKVICVNLKGVGQIVRRGHRLLVSITPTYFPMVYPAVNLNGLTIYPNETYMVLQTFLQDEEVTSSDFPGPKPLLQFPANQLTAGYHSLAETCKDGKFVQEIHENTGVRQFPTMNLEYEEKRYERYCTDKCVSHGDIVANQSIATTFDVEGHGKIKTNVVTSQEMIGNKQFFRVKENIKVVVDEKDIFIKHWDNVVPRKYV